MTQTNRLVGSGTGPTIFFTGPSTNGNVVGTQLAGLLNLNIGENVTGKIAEIVMDLAMPSPDYAILLTDADPFGVTYWYARPISANRWEFGTKTPTNEGPHRVSYFVVGFS